MGRLHADKNTAERILHAVRTVEQLPRSKQGRLRKNLLPGRTHEFGQCATAITAMTSAGVAGSGDVTIYTLSTAGVTAATTQTVKAYNVTLDAVSSGQFLEVQRNERNGLWLVEIPRRTNEFGKCDSAIGAMSTAGTAGSGPVTIYTMSTAGVTSATTQTITAYNLSLDPVSSGAWLQCQWNMRVGKWLVSFEDCGSS